MLVESKQFLQRAAPYDTGERRLLQNHQTLTQWCQWVLHIAVILIALYVCTMTFGRTDTFPDHYKVLGVVTALLVAIVYNMLGVFRRFTGIIEGGIRISQAWALCLGCLLAIGFVTKTVELYSRAALLVWAVSALLSQFAVYVGWRYASGAWHEKLQLNLPTLVIGTGNMAKRLIKAINGNAFFPDRVMGVLDADGDTPWEEPGIPVLGNLDNLIQVLDANPIDRIYIALPVQQSRRISELQETLLARNVDVIWAPDIFEFNLLNHSIREISGIPLISLSETPLIMGGRAYLKSLMDVVLALFLLALLSPVMLITAIAIKVTSKGPVFYRQARVGWDGSLFKVWKFRSMYVRSDEEENGQLRQATENDTRITPVGRILRKTSIDELPQLFNVLNGSMSLVGPRPHALAHHHEYSCQIAAYLARHRIKPGITGLAQVHGLRGQTETVDKMRARVQYDLDYINNWSLKLDLWILLVTPIALIRDRAY